MFTAPAAAGRTPAILTLVSRSSLSIRPLVLDTSTDDAHPGRCPSRARSVAPILVSGSRRCSSPVLSRRAPMMSMWVAAQHVKSSASGAPAMLEDALRALQDCQSLRLERSTDDVHRGGCSMHAGSAAGTARDERGGILMWGAGSTRCTLGVAHGCHFGALLRRAQLRPSLLGDEHR